MYVKGDILTLSSFLFMGGMHAALKNGGATLQQQCVTIDNQVTPRVYNEGEYLTALS